MSEIKIELLMLLLLLLLLFTVRAQTIFTKKKILLFIMDSKMQPKMMTYSP
jgi:hypothetical protein